MTTPTKKKNTGKCEYCSPEMTSELCKLSTATTTIDGKVYSACCTKCAGNEEEKSEKTEQNKTKK